LVRSAEKLLFFGDDKTEKFLYSNAFKISFQAFGMTSLFHVRGTKTLFYAL